MEHDERCEQQDPNWPRFPTGEMYPCHCQARTDGRNLAREQMRHLHKSWQDKRPGWTRRVRWYEYNPGFEGLDIRLEFTDESGVKNEYFTSAEDAQKEFDAFRNGERQLYRT